MQLLVRRAPRSASNRRFVRQGITGIACFAPTVMHAWRGGVHTQRLIEMLTKIQLFMLQPYKFSLFQQILPNTETRPFNLHVPQKDLEVVWMGVQIQHK